MQEHFSNGEYSLESLVEIKDNLSFFERLKVFFSTKSMNIYPSLGREILCDLWSAKLEKKDISSSLEKVYFSQFLNLSDVIIINSFIHPREVQNLVKRIKSSNNVPYVIMLGRNVVDNRKRVEDIGLKVDILLSGNRPDAKAWKEAFNLLVRRIEKGVCANA